MFYNNFFKNNTDKKVSCLQTSDNINFDVTHSCLEYYVSLEENYFNINRQHVQSTHISIKDNSLEILQESFNDFIQSVISFFKNLLDKFTEFMKRLFMVIYAYLGDFEKFLDKYKNNLRNLNPKFDIKGYKYTFKANIPNLDIVNSVINSYNSELSDIDNTSKDNIIEKREKFMATSNLNKIRSTILGKSGETDSEDFIKETKKLFRDGEEDKIDIEVNKSFLTTVIADYPFLKKQYSDAVKERDDIISIIDKIKTFFEKSASVYYKEKNKTIGAKTLNRDGNKIKIGNTVEHGFDGGKMKVINTFFSFKFTQSKEIGGMCTTACIEKVNALKEIIKRCAFKGPNKSTEAE